MTTRDAYASGSGETETTGVYSSGARTMNQCVMVKVVCPLAIRSVHDTLRRPDTALRKYFVLRSTCHQDSYELVAYDHFTP